VQMTRGKPASGERPRTRIGHKLILSFVLLVMAVVGLSGWVLFELTDRSLERQMRDHLVSVATLVSTKLSGSVLPYLHEGREHSTLYRNLMLKLQRAEQGVGARHIFVFDREYRSLLDTDGLMPIGREYPKLLFHRRELERVWRGHTAHSVLFYDGDIPYMTGYAPIFHDGEVVAAVGVEIGAGFVDSIRVFGRSVLIFAGLGALLTVGVAWGLARTLTRPIQKLVEAAREIGRGNMNQEVATASDDEIGYLGETMEEMRRKLVARDAQLRLMLGGVAHEIRNPLSSIDLYAGLIAGDLPASDERKQHIEKVIEEVRRLNGVISEFLEFARPAPAQPQPTELAPLVANAAFLLAPEMQSAGISYEERVAPDLVCYIDAEQMERALVNLMKNAVQAMRDGGHLTVRATVVGDEVVVEVADDGSGMSEEVQARLFEPFFTTKEKGSGLGMALVARAVEENRGRIEIDSRQGEGTVCRLRLPQSKDGVLWAGF
ncbi:MAG: HAMP domain-containing protein, partial [Gemmatimonadetes bacterium]|nr:HAMP domain-containing protein [Gemmatimonadota bacterium]